LASAKIMLFEEITNQGDSGIRNHRCITIRQLATCVEDQRTVEVGDDGAQPIAANIDPQYKALTAHEGSITTLEPPPNQF
jgi:hypothetical protein